MQIISPLLLAFAIWSGTLFSQPYEEISAAEETEQIANESQKENQPMTIQGIILLGCHEDVLKEGGWEAGGVYTYNMGLPSYDQTAFLEGLSITYLGSVLEAETLKEIKNAILCYYRKCHHPFVVVEIPPQNITQGVIQFVVMEACIGDIRADGCCWFNDDCLVSRLNVSPGQAIVTDALLTEVAWLNNNPFRHSDIRFTPGLEPGTTDIELVTTDRLPVRPYIGIDNTGNRVTGHTRYFTGFILGDLFDFDHVLTYQATFSSNFNDFFAQSANYVAPMPWKNTLYLFGGYARVRPRVSRHFHCQGHSSQASIRYEVPFGTIYEAAYQDFRVGFDYKNTNNNLVFLSDNEIPLIVNDVNLSQFMFGLDYGVMLCNNLFEASYQIFYSPGQLLSKESKKNYNKLRRGATSHYVYGTVTAGYVYPFCNGMTLGLVGRGQYASRNLLPSEQFGLGGYDTVRGYDEREVNVDNAACFNFELRSKPISFFTAKFFDETCSDQLIFLAFLDYGVGYNAHSYRGEFSRFNLLGIGPGIRYNLSSYLAARLDVGFKLIRTPFDDNNGAHLHFGVIASF